MMKVIIKQNLYQDSVALMQISSKISALPGIVQASVIMGTVQNKSVLRESGLYKPELDKAKPSDLIVAFRAENPDSGRKAMHLVDRLLAEPGLELKATGKMAGNEVSIRTAIEVFSEANMAAISVPGSFAAAEAMKALKSNANVFLFSDNVSIEDEVRLKRYAWSKNLLLMGPDCGTAYIDGVPFGFVNKVRRGTIGIIGSSGTGIQEIMVLVHRFGAGISHVIGTGSHDLYDAVGGLSTSSAITALELDEGTETIILVSKPASNTVLEKTLETLADTGKKIIAYLQGFKPEKSFTGVRIARTLKEVAILATNIEAEQNIVDFTGIRAQGKFIRGLYSGGTLAGEAYQLLKDQLDAVSLNPRKVQPGHFIIDMGDDNYTVGKPHPIIDLSDRLAMFKRVAADKETGVVLMDIVLGFSAHPDPASELAPLICSLRGEDGPEVVIDLVGTELDVQNIQDQADKLSDAGAIVLNNNYDAVLTALQMVTGAGKDGKDDA